MPASVGLEPALIGACTGKRLLVLDYDGTLAYLAVDWTSVRRDLSRAAAAFGFRSEFRPLFDEMARFRDEHGTERLPSLFRVLARHEEIGVDGQRARTDVVQAVRLAALETGADTVVFSVNLRRTIEVGLSKLELESISAIVGADDVRHWKPDPEGLVLLLKRAGLESKAAIFVGDSDRDALAAQAAGVDFFRV